MDDNKINDNQMPPTQQAPVEVRGVPSQRNVLDHAEYKQEREENNQSVFGSSPLPANGKSKEAPKNNLILPTKKMLAVILIGIVGVLALFAYTKLRPASQNKNVLGVTTESKQLSMVEKVAQLVVIPNNEEPSQIANISNIKKLMSNPFFKNGQDGDVLLVYEKSNQAVLYRPSTNQVVAIGPIGADLNVSNEVASPSPTLITAPIPTDTVVPTSIIGQ